MAEIRLTAVGTEREMQLDSPGIRTLFICFAQETQADIEAVEETARQRYSEAGQLLVGHVIDLHKIPGMFRKVAEATLKSEYEKAVAALSPSQDAEGYVVMLPDWDGSAIEALGLEDASKRLGVALVAADGRAMARDQSDDPGAATLKLLTA